MNIFHTIFLGFLQGATEFLPISSSGHLVLVETFLGLEEVGLAFDVALHLGTLAALFIYFRADFLLMAKSLLLVRDRSKEAVFYRKIFFFICLATMPAVVAGVFLGDAAETTFRQPWLVTVTLTVGGLLLLLAEKMGKRNREFNTISIRDGMLIGVAQAIAIIPGVSRSGITMTAGLLLGIDRSAAARFSFLLSAPVILGAGIYHMPTILSQGLQSGQSMLYITGFLSSAVSGYLFISFLLRFVQKRSLAFFAYYRFVLAALVLLIFIL